jgi:hypothetical protein
MRSVISMALAAAALIFSGSLAFAAPPEVLAVSILAGGFDPNGKVPAINAVKGSAESNISVAFPRGILEHGVSYVYAFVSQNNTFKGKCKDSYELTQEKSGKTVTLESGVIKSSYNCTPGTLWMWATIGKPIPNARGTAKLVGIVTFGNKTARTEITILIQ